MPALIDAVRAYATEGEIMDALADVFGRYVENAGSLTRSTSDAARHAPRCARTAACWPSPGSSPDGESHRVRHQRRQDADSSSSCPQSVASSVVVTSDPPPRPVAAYGGGAFDWTPDGRCARVRRHRRRAVASSCDAAGRRGRSCPRQPAGACAAPAVSPDGTRVAFVVDQQHVAVAPVDGSAWPVRLSGDADFCFDPSWSPDERTGRVARVGRPRHAVGRGPHRRARRRRVGRAASVVAGGPGISVQQPRFSPDGTRLAYPLRRDRLAQPVGRGRRRQRREAARRGTHRAR